LLSADGLASTMGLIPGEGPQGIDEDVRRELISRQLGGLQQTNPSIRMTTHCEYAAKYLPQTIQKWRGDESVISGPSILLSEISWCPYFMRLAILPENQDFVVLQFKRALLAADAMNNMPSSDVAQILQFLSTLLVVQGPIGISTEDKDAMIPRLRLWKRKFPGVLAGRTAERCLTVV
ncbi:hypothetical protein BD626DRAFT_366889, partial [Schizophyllum amplum]